jgi:hypothetical protein
MKWLLFLLCISGSWANPLEKMDNNLKTYQASQDLKCSSESTDNVLFVDVSCAITCNRSSEIKMERTKGVFSPYNEGLRPGNGSSHHHTIWASLGISLKTWSMKVCLEKASTLCKSLAEVSHVSISEVESGQWKINRFPGCFEKSAVISPFDEKSKSNRVFNPLLKLSPSVNKELIEFENIYNELLKPGPIKVQSKCNFPIIGKVCFGDCIDLKQLELKETIATPEPLGSDEIIICADELKIKLEKLSLSPSVKREFCESYFWNSLMKSESMIRTCAALRGEVSCPEL